MTDSEAKPREPYALLFPAGALFAFVGTALWPLALVPGVPYPGELHAALMLEGFELAFVSGFLLTIVPRLTRTAPAVREGRVALLLVLAFALCALTGFLAAAHACALVLVAGLATVFLARMRARTNDPPEEAVFIPVGLLLGIAGAALAMLARAGVVVEVSPRLGLRLLGLGMVLSFVLGFGTLLVPVFLEIKDPLVLPRIAKPHERPRRRALYLAVATGLALTFAFDALGMRALAAYGRAALATLMLALGWKAWRTPGRKTLPAALLRVSGWCVGAGLWAAALLPRFEVAALHVVLIGGYGALTMGIASRVTVTHGGRGPDAEGKLVTPARAGLLALALLLRLVAEADLERRPWWLAAAAACWMAAWAGWLVRTFALR